MQSISLRPRGSVVDNSDRRTGPRLKTLVTALVTAPSVGGPEMRNTTCLDLSTTGMVFTFKRALRIRSGLIATIRLPDSSIETTASVVRCERARRPGWWKIAVRFNNLFEDDQERIAEYVEEESENRFRW